MSCLDLVSPVTTSDQSISSTGRLLVKFFLCAFHNQWSKIGMPGEFREVIFGNANYWKVAAILVSDKEVHGGQKQALNI